MAEQLKEQLKLDNLVPFYKSNKSRRRVGRGIGSGLGKTCGKGHKGQKARAGCKMNPGFAGGQTTLSRGKPKYGTFTNRMFKKYYSEVNLGKLNEVCNDGELVDVEYLLSKGLIRKELDGVRILGNGEFTRKNVKIQAAGFTKSALEKIKNADGEAEVI